MDQNNIKKGLGLGRSSPQELAEGPRSGPHLLVIYKIRFKIIGESLYHSKKKGATLMLQHNVIDCEMLHVIFLDFLDFSIKYLANVTFGTVSAFQMR